MKVWHRLVAAAGSFVLVVNGADGQSPLPRDPNLALINRVTWGMNAADVRAIGELGARGWLNHQLHPSVNDRLPPAIQAQIDALPVSRIPMAQLVVEAQTQAQTANSLTDATQKAAAQATYQQALNALAHQAATRDVLRDIYSPSQLREQMTWFWFNHFNVHQYKAGIRAMVGDYEEQAIRPRALGSFRDLLEATLRHPAMLIYLDNASSSVGKINENYAREIMELHTLGVGAGYTQKDVQELARILTGVGIDSHPDNPVMPPRFHGQLIRQGLFEFDPRRHDYGDKVFLGHMIKGRGFAEVEQALDILCRQPATARHISRQLATYFVSDIPPERLVARMADTFQRSNGDIAKVLSTMFAAPEFSASLGSRFKDPVHYVLSAMRLAYGDQQLSNATPIQNWLNRLGEGLYNHETPDGYPMTASQWNGPGQMGARFELARQIGAGGAALFKAETSGGSDGNGFPLIQNALYFNRIAPTLTPATRAALAQARSPEEWNTLFLSAPDFMWR